MKLHSFHELAQRITNLSTRDGKPVRLTFGGQDAYTNGQIVNLPALESGTVLTPHQFSVWLGYALHEGPGHLSHSDMPRYIAAVKAKNSPVFSQILNILEDIRIENADIKLYPGDRKYLDSTHQFCDDQIPAEKCQNPDIFGLIYKEAYKYRGLDTGRLKGDLKDLSIPIYSLMQTLPSCKSTQDCIELAEKIIRLLPANRPNPTPPQAGGETPGESGHKQNQQNQGDKSAECDPDECDPDADSSKSQSLAESQSLSDLAQEWNELTEIKNIINQLVQQGQETQGQNPSRQFVESSHSGSISLPPTTLTNDRVFVFGKEDLQNYIQVKSALAPQITSLKKMFRIYLQSRAKKSWLRGLENGETLDQERLPLVATGNASVFKNKHNKTLINTAVELMLDLSSSMDQGLVQSTAILLAEALNTIPQIKLDICGFKTNHMTTSSVPNTGRRHGMDILIFKSFDESYTKCRARLGGISTGGATPLGDAYGKALERIIPRQEPRKIIFLVTDGQPGFAVSDRRHSDYVLMDHVYKKCKTLKVETLGFGLGYDESIINTLNPCTDKTIQIQNAQTLSQALMEALKGVVK